MLRWSVYFSEQLWQIRHFVLLKQADVEIDFEMTSIDSANPFDPA